MFCWGLNSSGQLGDGTTNRSLTPVRVEGAWSSGATQISTGGYFSCLLRQTGRIACWGNNRFGQLGDGTNISRSVPGPVTGLTAVTQFDSGHYHNCALRSSGRVFCWGYNAQGALGNRTTNTQFVPVRVSNLTGATQVSAGGYWGTSCALRNTGRIFCWGHNGQGQLGNGTSRAATTPVRVGVVTGGTQVSVGLYHVCGRGAGDQVYCWGRNTNAQLGDGTIVNRTAPVQVVD
jgi:alpha-tubulin suppressor-like RCC1 family protein